MLPLLDLSNEQICWLDEAQAREMIRKQEVELLWSKRRVRALRLRAAAPSPAQIRAYQQLGGTRYSHNRETPVNPRNCWTLTPLPSGARRIFRQVLTDCAA